MNCCPLLKSHYQPALSKVVLRLMEIVGEEAQLAKGLAEGWLQDTSPSRPKKSFSQLPVAVQRHCLRIQLLGRRNSRQILTSSKNSGLTLTKA